MVDIKCYWDDNVSNPYLMNANIVTWLSGPTNLPFLNNFQQTSPDIITIATPTAPPSAPPTAPKMIPSLSGKRIIH